MKLLVSVLIDTEKDNSLSGLSKEEVIEIITKQSADTNEQGITLFKIEDAPLNTKEAVGNIA